MKIVDRILSWPEKAGSAIGLDLIRVVVGLMVIRHLAYFVRTWSQMGFFGDFFYLPYFAWLPVPNETQFLVLLATGMVAGAGMVTGLWPRFWAALAFFCVTYHFLLNEIWYRHNRYFLVLILGFLCLNPGKGALAWRKKKDLGTANPNFAWGEFLIKAQMSLIYLASASSKTLDAAWSSGAVLKDRHLETFWVEHLPSAVIDTWTSTFGDDEFSTTAALATEFILAVALWLPWTRKPAIWVGVIFHGFIELSAAVATFSYLSMASYFLYARLDVHKKRLILPTTSWLRWPMIAIVSLFDWLLQIEIQHAPVDRMRFVDRSQKSYLGISAWIMLAANLPISFLFFYPMQVLLLVFRRGRWLEPVAASAIGRPQLSVFWLVPVLVAHLAFIFAVNATQQYRIAFDSGRLYDLPWYLAIMCLLSLIYGGRERRPSNHAVIGPVAAEELTSPPAQSGSI